VLPPVVNGCGDSFAVKLFYLAQPYTTLPLCDFVDILVCQTGTVTLKHSRRIE
jgi:hypothetical protein